MALIVSVNFFCHIYCAVAIMTVCNWRAFKKLIMAMDLDRVQEIYDDLRRTDLQSGDRMFFDRDDLVFLAETTQEVLARDDTLVEIQAPVTIIGDIHAQYVDLRAFLKMSGDPETTKFLFLGDYIDRGPNSLEVLVLLFSMKCLFPKNVFLLRGNHEAEDVCARYGFLEECTERYDEDLFYVFNETFTWLPLAARINSCVFCVHGGICEQLELPDTVSEIKRPVRNILNHDIFGSLVSDILWSDPAPNQNGWAFNPRGVGWTFGADVCKEWMDQGLIRMLVRAHEVVNEGAEFPFPGVNFVTLFSAPNYSGIVGNKGAIMHLDEQLTYTFHYITPLNYFPAQAPKEFNEYSDSDDVQKEDEKGDQPPEKDENKGQAPEEKNQDTQEEKTEDQPLHENQAPQRDDDEPPREKPKEVQPPKEEEEVEEPEKDQVQTGEDEEGEGHPRKRPKEAPPPQAKQNKGTAPKGSKGGPTSTAKESTKERHRRK